MSVSFLATRKARSPAITAHPLLLEGLTKDYHGRRALDGVTLAVQRGEVFGYLGPNGAGKTTTIRLVLGLLRPTAGHAEVFGMDTWRYPVAVHARTGYLPGEATFPDHLTGLEVIRYFARLRQRPGDVDSAGKLARRFDLDLAKRIHSLSRGNRQKLAIVQAFMSEPELAILDEPTSGLDPIAQQEFHQLLRETTAAGGTVLLSSHVLAEVQRIADRVGVIRAGRLVAVERLETLRSKALHRVVARVADGGAAAERLGRIDGMRELSIGDGFIRCRVPETSLDALVKTLAGLKVLDLSVTETDLEEMFLSFYGDPNGYEESRTDDA